jgi:nitrate reductase cytochrome c-type subunit
MKKSISDIEGAHGSYVYNSLQRTFEFVKEHYFCTQCHIKVKNFIENAKKENKGLS